MVNLFQIFIPFIKKKHNLFAAVILEQITRKNENRQKL